MNIPSSTKNSNNHSAYDADKDIIAITGGLFDSFLTKDRGADLIILYLFYIKKARKDGNNQPWANVGYVAKGLGWTEDRVRKARNSLKELGIIQDIRNRKPDGTFDNKTYTYVRIAYSASELSTLPDFLSLDNPDSGKTRVGKSRGEVLIKKESTHEEIEVPIKKKNNSSEPAMRVQEPLAETVLEYQCKGKPKTWNLTKSQLNEWVELYPVIDVLAECRKAKAWEDANPLKRKTASGKKRFLVNWLNRANDNRRRPLNHTAHSERFDEANQSKGNWEGVAQ